MTDVIQLSDDALVQAINDEYSLILQNERGNLQRALAIGEKLVALKSRMEHGKWKPYLKEHCEISYETAAVYMRVYSKQAEWRAKNADPASLTIEGVLKLLTKPTPDTVNKGSVSKPSKTTKAALEPAMDPKPSSLPPDQIVKNLELDYGDMFETLKSKYDQDDLLELTKLLAAHLGIVLMPISQSKALMEAIGVAETSSA
jgi:Protein of unknown function (DUF3102)